VPLNIMCSKKCRQAVIPGASLRLPARTQLLSCDVRNIVHRPDDDLEAIGQSRGTHGLTGPARGHRRLNGRGQRAHGEKMRAKVFVHSRSLPVQPTHKASTEQKSARIRTFVITPTPCARRRVRKPGLQETSGAPVQFELQAKKRRRERGRRIAARRSEHRGRGSLFKPYTSS